MEPFEITEKQVMFHGLFLKRGGIYIPNKKNFFHNILDAANSHTKAILRSTAPEKELIIYIDFIHNESFGAVVAKIGDVYNIGIHMATVAILSNFFNRALSCPTVLTRYGDVSKEIQDYKIYNPNTFEMDQILRQDGPLKVIPIDEKRVAVAGILVGLAVNFLVTHELGHILNGHVDYLKSEGILSWDESEDVPDSLTDKELVQTLEYDADCFAWNFMINAAFATHEFQSSNFISKSESFIYKNLGELIGLTSFAMYTCFRLFGTDVPIDGNLLSTKHPHRKLRKMFMGDGICSLLDMKVKLGRINEQQMYSLGRYMLHDFAEVERAFAAINTNGEALSNSEMAAIFDNQSASAYEESFSKRWIRVRGLLLPHALIELVD